MYDDEDVDWVTSIEDNRRVPCTDMQKTKGSRMTLEWTRQFTLYSHYKFCFIHEVVIIVIDAVDSNVKDDQVRL